MQKKVFSSHRSCVEYQVLLMRHNSSSGTIFFGVGPQCGKSKTNLVTDGAETTAPLMPLALQAFVLPAETDVSPPEDDDNI